MTWLDNAIVTTAEEKEAVKLIQDQSEIRLKYSILLLSVAKPYTPVERETWKTQEEEALQFQVDSGSPCTMIREMATQRGITIEVLVTKILANSSAFRLATGTLLGQQQAELDALLV